MARSAFGKHRGYALAALETNVVVSGRDAARPADDGTLTLTPWDHVAATVGERQLGVAATYGAGKAGATCAYRVLVKEYLDASVRVGFLRPGIMPTRVTLGDLDASQLSMLPRSVGLLSDQPETIAQHFAGRILRANRNEQRITWLTAGRMMRKLFSPSLRR